MTCIIGLADKNGKVYIGGDSAGISGYSAHIRGDVKVFRNGPFIMGFCDSFRMGQLLHHVFEPPEHPEGMDDVKYMVSVFVPAVKNCFKDGGYQKVKDSQESGGTFLVGYKGNLYLIDDDYQVGLLTDNMTAIGCGNDEARGAMYALDYMPPVKRIERALEITTHLNIGVRPPFVIEEL